MKKIFMTCVVCFFLITAGCPNFPGGTVAITGSWFYNDTIDDYYQSFNLYNADVSVASVMKGGPVESFFWGTVFRHYPNQKRIIIEWLDAESTGMLVHGTYQKVEWIGNPAGDSITLRFYGLNDDLDAAVNTTVYHDRVYERKIPR